MKTCGDCRWYEPAGDEDLPGRCRGGGAAIKMWPDNAACKAMLILMGAERERDEARALAGEAWAAGFRLCAEIERLRKALAPFAKAAGRIPDFGPHAKAIEDILAVNWKDGSLPMFGTEFHRARAALGGGGG